MTHKGIQQTCRPADNATREKNGQSLRSGALMARQRCYARFYLHLARMPALYHRRRPRDDRRETYFWRHLNFFEPARRFRTARRTLFPHGQNTRAHGFVIATSLFHKYLPTTGTNWLRGNQTKRFCTGIARYLKARDDDRKTQLNPRRAKRRFKLFDDRHLIEIYSKLCKLNARWCNSKFQTYTITLLINC